MHTISNGDLGAILEIIIIEILKMLFSALTLYITPALLNVSVINRNTNKKCWSVGYALTGTWHIQYVHHT